MKLDPEQEEAIRQIVDERIEWAIGQILAGMKESLESDDALESPAT